LHACMHAAAAKRPLACNDNKEKEKERKRERKRERERERKRDRETEEEKEERERDSERKVQNARYFRSFFGKWPFIFAC
jgi:hypothetical protein